MPAGARGNTWIAESCKTAFANPPEPFISLANNAGFSEIIRFAQKTFDPRQFCTNLLVAGAERWGERDWIDKLTDWWAATNVEPNARKCDLNIPQVLDWGFGHLKCGIYGRIVSAGLIEVRDKFALLP
uniref:Uncharacterized protein n=1 Tax=uncultured Rhodospirillales bacterium HF0070_31K06 TaxID=710786 RepID=E0XSM9_9PROT|nr:hypothetical protein [uncultured Rhodospirillales bacterium HF0070_31K06]